MDNKKISLWPYFAKDGIKAVTDILRSARVNQWTGQEVFKFEKEYADYIGVKYSVALANGSVALDTALMALNIGPGDEVIVPCRSFVASASCVALRGAIPVFSDIDRDSQNITVSEIEKVFTKKTKAIIIVHLAGWPCELDKIRDTIESITIFQNIDVLKCPGIIEESAKIKKLMINSLRKHKTTQIDLYEHSKQFTSTSFFYERESRKNLLTISNVNYHMINQKKRTVMNPPRVANRNQIQIFHVNPVKKLKN